MHYIGRRARETNPLRSLPLFTPAHRIFGWHPLDKARELLRQAECDIPVFVARFDQACAALGRANRCTAPAMRRMRQGEAMRQVNMQRRQLLDGHRTLAERRAELERLEREPELPFPPRVVSTAPTPELLGHVRILREASGTFPARSVATADLAPKGGCYAKITRPDGSGIATHVESYAAALAWLDATLAAPVLH